MTVHDILHRLQGVKGGHGQWTARCPAHDDKSNSLSVSEGEDGRVLLYCHAGCDVDRITAALGISKSDLFPDKPRNRDYGTAEREHIYPGGNIKKVIPIAIINRADVGGKYQSTWQTAQATWLTIVRRLGPVPTLPKTGY